MNALQRFPLNRQDKLLTWGLGASLLLGRYFTDLYVSSGRNDMIAKTIGPISLYSKVCSGYLMSESSSSHFSNARKSALCLIAIVSYVLQYNLEEEIWKGTSKNYMSNLQAYYAISLLTIVLTALHILMRNKEVSQGRRYL